MDVRFGLNLLVYTAAFTAEDAALIERAAEMGFDGVEILFGDLDAIDPVAVRNALQIHRMGMTACCVMTEDANPCSESPEVRQAAVARLERMIDLTAEMGGNGIAGPLYAPVGCLTGRGRTNEEWNRCVDVMGAAADHARARGIVASVEPINRFETYVVNTVEDAVAMCREVASPALKVHVDTFHANIEEKNTPAAILAAGEYLGHFHASESDRGTPGTGQVPWKETFAALETVGYNGWVTIESFAAGIVDLCAAACIWRPIYDTADGLARDGLRFLRSTAANAKKERMASCVQHRSSN